jgi:hypothetical protein
VKLDFRQELRGDADIVTTESRVLQRVFDRTDCGVEVRSDRGSN